MAQQGFPPGPPPNHLFCYICMKCRLPVIGYFASITKTNAIASTFPKYALGIEVDWGAQGSLEEIYQQLVLHSYSSTRHSGCLRKENYSKLVLTSFKMLTG